MKVLFIRFSSLGDVLLTTPIIRTFREHFPDAEIHFLTKSHFAPLYKNNPYVDRIIEFDTSNETVLQLIIRLQKEHYTHIIDLHDKLRSGLIKRFVKGKSFTYQKKHAYRKKLLKDHSLEPIPSTVDLYASVLSNFDIELKKRKLDLFLPHNADVIATKFLPPNDKRFTVTISPGASWFTKQYPAEYYKKLIKMVLDKIDARVLLVGAEQEMKLTAELASVSPSRTLDLGGKTSVMETAILIERSDVFVSGDCGPMHMAAALGIPQIAIFGSTQPMLGFKPINDNAAILTAEEQCSPCSLHGRKQCPLGHFNCMKNISPEVVFSAINRHLNIKTS